MKITINAQKSAFPKGLYMVTATIEGAPEAAEVKWNPSSPGKPIAVEDSTTSANILVRVFKYNAPKGESTVGVTCSATVNGTLLSAGVVLQPIV